MPIVDFVSSEIYPGGTEVTANTAQSSLVSSEWGALMAEAQVGNPTAYRKLLVELSGWLEHFYRQRLPCESVEEGVLEALRLIHRIRHTYDPRRPFDRWLTAIAQHQCAKRRATRVEHRASW